MAHRFGCVDVDEAEAFSEEVCGELALRLGGGHQGDDADLVLAGCVREGADRGDAVGG